MNAADNDGDGQHHEDPLIDERLPRVGDEIAEQTAERPPGCCWSIRPLTALTA